MSLRAKLLIVLLSLLAGATVAVIARQQNWFPGEADWEAQVASDTEELLKVLGPPPELSVDLDAEPEFWTRWDEHRRAYAEEPRRLEQLRGNLMAFVDLMEAEYGDVRAITLADSSEVVSVMESPSRAVREGRRRIVERLGPLGEAIVADAEALREEAFRASPGVAGYDLDAEDFAELGLRVSTEWAPRARERVRRLTEPLPAD